MKLSNNLDDRVADDLATRIDNVINADLDLTQGEILKACAMIIYGVLASIQCPDCRKINAKMIKRELSHVIGLALAEASDSNVGHVH